MSILSFLSGSIFLHFSDLPNFIQLLFLFRARLLYINLCNRNGLKKAAERGQLGAFYVDQYTSSGPAAITSHTSTSNITAMHKDLYNAALQLYAPGAEAAADGSMRRNKNEEE